MSPRVFHCFVADLNDEVHVYMFCFLHWADLIARHSQLVSDAESLAASMNSGQLLQERIQKSI